MRLVFELLRQIADGSETDPQARIAEFVQRRDDLDAEIEQIRAGKLSLCSTPPNSASILNRLRANLPEAQSFLMDRATLQAHRALWGREPADRRYTGDTSRLSRDEYALFEDLLADRCGERVRLEQERIGYGWLETALGPGERRSTG